MNKLILTGLVSAILAVSASAGINPNNGQSTGYTNAKKTDYNESLSEGEAYNRGKSYARSSSRTFTVISQSVDSCERSARSSNYGKPDWYKRSWIKGCVEGFKSKSSSSTSLFFNKY